MEEHKDKKRTDLPADLTFFDPENPPFEPQCLCVYLREPEDEKPVEGAGPEGQVHCRELD